MRSLVLPAFLLLSACAASGEAPASGPQAAPAECTAVFGKQAPAGWIDTGAVVRVTFKGGKPTAVEGQAPGGAVHAVTLPVDGEDKQREAMSQEICRLGGLFGALDAPPREAKDGTVALHVTRPPAPSEKADLALFCAGPPDPRLAAGGFDSQAMRVLAMLALREVLTTPRWRSWILAKSRRLRDAEAQAKDAVYAEMVAELRAAGAPEACWFASTILAH
jgi:hypothetical protein